MAPDSTPATALRRRRLAIGAALSALALTGGTGAALADGHIEGGSPAPASEQPSGSGPDPEPAPPAPAPAPTPPAAPAPTPVPPGIPAPAPGVPAPSPAPSLPPVELPGGGGPEAPVAQLKIGIVSPERAVAGSEQTYTIVVVNRGDALAENVTVEQRIVAQLGIVDPAVAALRVDNRTIAWEVGTLAPGERWTIAYTVTMPTDAKVVAGTRASVAWDGGTSATKPVRTILTARGGETPAAPAAPEPAPGPSPEPAPTAPPAVPDAPPVPPPAAPPPPAPGNGGEAEAPKAELKIGIIAPRQARAGSRQTYVVVVLNRSGSAAENVRVEQRIIAQLGIPDAAVAIQRVDDRTMAWGLGTIPAGGRWKVEYTVTMPADSRIVPGTKATVTWTGGSASAAPVRTILS